MIPKDKYLSFIKTHRRNSDANVEMAEVPKDLNSDCTVNKTDKPVEPTISCELRDPNGAESAKSEGILLKLL